MQPGFKRHFCGFHEPEFMRKAVALDTVLDIRHLRHSDIQVFASVIRIRIFSMLQLEEIVDRARMMDLVVLTGSTFIQRISTAFCFSGIYPLLDWPCLNSMYW